MKELLLDRLKLGASVLSGVILVLAFSVPVSIVLFIAGAIFAGIGHSFYGMYLSDPVRLFAVMYIISVLLVITYGVHRLNEEVS